MQETGDAGEDGFFNMPKNELPSAEDCVRIYHAENALRLPQGKLGVVNGTIVPVEPFVKLNGSYLDWPQDKQTWNSFVNNLRTLTNRFTPFTVLESGQLHAAVNAVSQAIRFSDAGSIGRIVMPYTIGFYNGASHPFRKQFQHTGLISWQEWEPSTFNEVIKMRDGARFLYTGLWMINTCTGKKYDHVITMNLDNFAKLA